MKASSLSMRLGLTVSLMGAGLVVLLATLAYMALTHELEKLARRGLESKMEQIQHSLALGLRPHPLRELVMGHDNFYLTIVGTAPNDVVLFNVGAKPQEPLLTNFAPPQNLGYLNWDDSHDNQVLSASSLMRLSSGERVRVLLSLDRGDDRVLLSAYLHSTLLALPLLLLLIGIGAWWVVQRGLAPLQQFSRVAAKVSTQELTHRLALDNLPKELGELAQGINFMLQRLDGGVQQLSQFSDDLAHELRAR